MSGRGFHQKGYAHMQPNEKSLGPGAPIPAKVPSNILVRPLQGPPMVPIKDADERCTCADMDGFEECPVHI
jgi:hypothetical protein